MFRAPGGGFVLAPKPMHSKSTIKLSDLLSAAESAGKLRLLVQDLFTEEEMATVLERWQALSLLLEGQTHREVQARVGISISKVTHAANLLKAGGGKGVRALQKKSP